MRQANVSWNSFIFPHYCGVSMLLLFDTGAWKWSYNISEARKMLYDVYYSEKSVRCGLGVRRTRARMKKKKKLKHNSFQLTNKLTNKQVRVLYNYISIVQFVVCLRASERAFSWWWNHDDDDVCAFESARLIGTQHSTHITIWLVCIFAPFDWVNVARCVSQMTFIRMDSFVSFSVRFFFHVGV